jgi:hypothetical protein
MEFTIFHNDHAVCTVNINEDYEIDSILKVHNTPHLPVGLLRKNGISIMNINRWLFDRAIPDRRYGLSDILEKEGVKSNRELLIKNLGLSLSDHYWIKTEREQKTWNDVNFYENNFGEKGDDIYIGEIVEHEKGALTPNGASSGMLPKKWIIQDGKRYLLKGGENIFNQEPYNEAAASCFLEKAEINHVRYDLVLYKGKHYSLCENMLGNENELVQAWYIEKIEKQRNEISNYDHYINCCKLLGFDNSIYKAIDKMITADYLMANTDRHWMNFGIIRNAETLKAVCLAPLYDNGASFYAKTGYADILKGNNYLRCQSFKSNQEDALKLVKDISWLNKDAVHELPDILNTWLQKNKYLSANRRNRVIDGIKDRIDLLKTHYREWEIGKAPEAERQNRHDGYGR